MTGEEGIIKLAQSVEILHKALETRSNAVIEAFQEVQDLCNSFKQQINQLQFQVDALLADKNFTKLDS